LQRQQMDHRHNQGLGREQGDQIGRIFAHWVILYYGQFFQLQKAAHIFGLLLFMVCISFD
jgi:hypothetical protein